VGKEALSVCPHRRTITHRKSGGKTWNRPGFKQVLKWTGLYFVNVPITSSKIVKTKA
jgi:hypothetical protein